MTGEREFRKTCGAAYALNGCPRPGVSRFCTKPVGIADVYCRNCGRPLVGIEFAHEKDSDGVPWVYADRNSLLETSSADSSVVGLYVTLRNDLKDWRAINPLLVRRAELRGFPGRVSTEVRYTRAGEPVPPLPFVIEPQQTARIPLELDASMLDPTQNVSLSLLTNRGRVVLPVRIIPTLDYNISLGGEGREYIEPFDPENPPPTLNLPLRLRAGRTCPLVLLGLRFHQDEKPESGEPKPRLEGDASRASFRLRDVGMDPPIDCDVEPPISVGTGATLECEIPVGLDGMQDGEAIPFQMRFKFLGIEEEIPFRGSVTLQGRGRIQVDRVPIEVSDRTCTRDADGRSSSRIARDGVLTYHEWCPSVYVQVPVRNVGEQPVIIGALNLEAAHMVVHSALVHSAVTADERIAPAELPGRELAPKDSLTLVLEARLNEAVAGGVEYLEGRLQLVDPDGKNLATAPISSGSIRRPHKVSHQVVIDLGTSSTCLMVSRAIGEEAAHWLLSIDGTEAIPTTVFFEDISDPEHPTVLIGRQAEQRLRSADPRRGVRAFKRLLGTDYPITVTDRNHRQHTYTAEEVTRIYLARLYDELAAACNVYVTSIVATYPLGFALPQRDQLERAMRWAMRPYEERKAGPADEASCPDVLFACDEATAVASDFILSSEPPGSPNAPPTAPYGIVTFDFGGGTLDVLIGRVAEKGRTRTLTLSRYLGLRRFGGEDVTMGLIGHLKRGFEQQLAEQDPNAELPCVAPSRRTHRSTRAEIANGSALYDEADRAKIELSRAASNGPEENPEMEILPPLLGQDENPLRLEKVTLTYEHVRQVLEDKLDGVVCRILDEIKQRSREFEGIPLVVLLTGQASRLPLVKATFSRLFPKDTIYPSSFVGAKKEVVRGAFNFCSPQEFALATEPSIQEEQFVTMPIVLEGRDETIACELMGQFELVGTMGPASPWFPVPPVTRRVRLSIRENHADRLDLGGDRYIARDICEPVMILFDEGQKSGFYRVAIRLDPAGPPAPRHALTIQVYVWWHAGSDGSPPPEDLPVDPQNAVQTITRPYLITPVQVERLGKVAYV